jgi:4'-phosphopantetheinyl transferase
MIELHSDDVDLWLTSCDEVAEARIQHRYPCLLDPRELEQQERFHFERDRLRHLIARALVRTVLSRYLPLGESAWTFSTNAYGRPRIANASALPEDLRFNLSHSNDLVVLAVTRGREVGVDVESTRAQAVDAEVADHFFAPAEAAALAQLPPERRHFRFLEYWTFKESYIKARGMGISIPLDKFAFDYPDDQHVRIAIDTELEDDAGRWQFWQLRPSAEYLVAVCAERTATRATRLRVRTIVPGAMEQSIVPALTRVSEPVR